MNNINIERLHELLDYDSAIGIFRWQVEKSAIAKPGVVAGCADPRGYVRIRLDRKYYYAHRLAWFWMHQYWPKQMDHIDGNPSNNAISNLREATPAQNVCNTRVRRDSSTGIKGVWQHDSKFIVVIQANNERKYYGIFNTFEEARLMAAQTRREVHGAFAREA